MDRYGLTYIIVVCFIVIIPASYGYNYGYIGFEEAVLTMLGGVVLNTAFTAGESRDVDGS